MSYLTITETIIIGCLVAAAGCVHAQHGGKKGKMIPAMLPGMGAAIHENTQNPAVLPAAPVTQETVAGKNAKVPRDNGEIITHEVSTVMEPAKPLSAAATAQITPGQTPVKAIKGKNKIPPKNSALKSPVEITNTISPDDQKPVSSSATVTQAAPVQPEAGKQPLLPPTPDEIEQLKMEDTHPSITPKHKNKPQTAAAAAEEPAEEKEPVKQNKSEIKPEPAIQNTELSPQISPEPAAGGSSEINTASPVKDNGRFANKDNGITPPSESMDSNHGLKPGELANGLITSPAKNPAEEKRPAELLTKPSTEQRQQAVRQKLKEEEEKKKTRRAEETKHPARMHTVVAGDTLPLLAEKYYGDKNSWGKIYDANKDKIEKGSFKADQLILIP